MDSTENDDSKLSKSGVIKHATTIIKLLAFLVFLWVTPMVVHAYFQQNGYVFPENVGYISQNIYENIELNENVMFDKQEAIHIDHINIGEYRVRVILANSQLFDIGLPSDVIHWGLTNFDRFEFLYGNPFNEQYQVVISESVSLRLFDKSNSIGESITIHQTEYMIVGVVADTNELIKSIYFEYSTLESVLDKNWAFYNYQIFQDEDLIMKLYDKGGIDLVNKTITLKNQKDFSFVMNMSTNLVIICFGIINLLIYKPKSKVHEEYDRSNENLMISYIKLNIGLTAVLLYSLMIFIIIYSIHTSYQLSYRYLMDQIQRFYWVLSIYLIPVIIIGVEIFIKKYRRNRQI